MKKILFAILVLCVLTGCTGNDSGSSSSNSKDVYLDLNDDIAITGARYFDWNSEASVQIKIKIKRKGHVCNN